MKYLLDVNALVALGFAEHEMHLRAADWLRSEGFPELVTCSITELGFVRVLAQVSHYGLTVAQAKTALLQLKKSDRLSLTLVADVLDISRLPAWVKSPKQTTDGHLAALAKVHGAELATFDRGIPGAFHIP